jgi:hypothetical protein
MMKVIARTAVCTAWSSMVPLRTRSTPVVMPIATRPLNVITAR